MTEIDEVVVVVPARDEAELISRCMTGLVRARVAVRDRFGDRAPVVRLIVVADGCSDATAELARNAGADEVIEIAAAGVGAARGLGIARALETSVLPPERIWLANTDADSQVYASWIVDQLTAANSGADVIIGGVIPDFADLTPHQIRAWKATHDRGQARGHIHGANLGVRASAYLRAGGFPGILVGEDVALVDLATRHGASVFTHDSVVLTSGRGVGHAAGTRTT
jgi:glycosyltransferase involved in cell wall biosynthesis